MVIAPRPFGQVLGDAINGLARVWRPVTGPALAASVPAGILTLLAFRLSGGQEFVDLILNNPDQLASLPSELFWNLARPFLIAVGISLLVQIVTGVFISLLSHFAVAGYLVGEAKTGKEVSRAAFGRLPRALIAMAMILLAVAALAGVGWALWLRPLTTVGIPNLASLLVALILFVVLLGPGIWLAVSTSMTTSVIAIEGDRALASVLRSMRLVRGRWLVTLGYLMLVGLAGGIAIQLIQVVALPFAAIGDTGTDSLFGAAAIVGVLVQGLLIAGIASMYTHWYIDLRSRREELATEDLR